jgi:hypothetical protein
MITMKGAAMCTDVLHAMITYFSGNREDSPLRNQALHICPQAFVAYGTSLLRAYISFTTSVASTNTADNHGSRATRVMIYRRQCQCPHRLYEQIVPQQHDNLD